VIVEHAILEVREGQHAAFEAAMREATPLIAASDGFLGMEVRPCIEKAGRYLLLVKWRSVADHDPGFRGSDRYPRWKALLRHFYEPFPLVEHYGEPVATA
jgi:heme-degrading monooxygenase HmoA